MKFITSRENLLMPLQQVVGVIEKRQTLPILSNVLLRLSDNRLEFSGTDLEVQLVTQSMMESGEDGDITVPARKLLDICRLLPDSSAVNVECRNEKFALNSGRSRFTLSTLPADNYPAFESAPPDAEISLSARLLKKALEKTLYAMAMQDVRYYLNGLLLDLDGRTLRTVSSDGHRLALNEETLEDIDLEPRQVIVPRKGILELYRLLSDQDETVKIQFSQNNIRVLMGGLNFAAKLIEGRFPDFRRVMPKDITKVITANRDTFKAALTRVSVLTAEKIKGVSLEVKDGLMVLQSQNPENEEAVEEMEVGLQGDGLSVGFNTTYLLDALNNIDSDSVTLSFTDAGNSCLIEDPKDQKYKFIVMPMKL